MLVFVNFPSSGGAITVSFQPGVVPAEILAAHSFILAQIGGHGAPFAPSSTWAARRYSFWASG
ncbi:MAG: hypothetical protein U5O16_04765 [Rhodococcus sp. (in: high G+C Gram-positive bacteria)]|uniref:hypothetical protein n=1 Tax=Rhodococcus sp. TaxID=1831 RepID=UPI002AD6B630|nr:hypothetical protein [Rhodococcus sp. (in: high G+C Gram-positive bacteria)]